jgi:transcriptional regulator with XRE-family HTH domain
MSTFIWETAEEIDLELAKRARKIRKRRGITQQELSEKSGVSYGSIKRFEATGKISLLSLTKIAMELDCIDDVKTMFTKAVYRNIQEVINENK